MRRRLAALGATAIVAASAAAAGVAPGSARSSKAAAFEVGAAVQSFTPPPAGSPPSDPANCVPRTGSVFTGTRQFAFEEPYRDLQGSGHYDLGDPFLDCNQNGRWDGNFLGGGGNTPRYYDHVADRVGARAVVVSNGRRAQSRWRLWTRRGCSTSTPTGSASGCAPTATT